MNIQQQNEQSELKSFFSPRATRWEKWTDKKNRFAATLNQAEIPTAFLRQKSKLLRSDNFLGQQEVVQK